MAKSLKDYEKTLFNSIYGNTTINIDALYPNPVFSLTTEPEDKGTEEWVWITGYKGTDKDMKCRDYQFELGKQFDMPEGEKISLCYSGFHLCKELKNVYNFYKVKNGNRFFEVKALVRRYNKNGYYAFEHLEDKMTSKSIEFVRELTPEEVFKALRESSKKFDDTVNWTTAQMEQAMKTGFETVRNSIKAQELVKLGYSEVFATYVCEKGAYDVAYNITMQPGVSMDVKVLTIAMSIFD